MSRQDAELLKRLQEIANQLKATSESVQSLINELSGIKGAASETPTGIEGQLKAELGANLQQVEILSSPREIRIKPKSFLGSEVFRAVANVARKYGGRWDATQRCFIINIQTRRT